MQTTATWSVGRRVNRAASTSNTVGVPTSNCRTLMSSLWMMVTPPPRLSVYDPRGWCSTWKPGGAMSSLIASGTSDFTQVSVSARTASLLSAMTSWITAALLTTERALSRPQTMLNGAAAAAAGPGLDSTPRRGHANYRPQHLQRRQTRSKVAPPSALSMRALCHALAPASNAGGSGQ